jgi:homoserine O-acetyltransferase/O-succinyltransferase
MNFSEHDFIVKDFRFASGEALPELRLHYRTLGDPRREGDRIVNAVLMLHGTTGSGAQFTQQTITEHLFRPGQPLDPARYFVILPDAIGHGSSSRPRDGLGCDFPRYSYADVVTAQHLLVTQGLGLSHLRLILGTSMGGMQTWVWGERFPDMMDALMPIASVPERVSGRNLLWRRLLIELIRSDPVYGGARYDRQPPMLGLAWALFELMVTSPAHLASAFDGPDAAERLIDKIRDEALLREDANDVIWEFDASRDYDPALALPKIKAVLLAVNFADDELNPAELGTLDRAIANVPRGRAILIPPSEGTNGHQTLRLAAVWARYVAEILAASEELVAVPS